jgi:esterase/lipase
LNNLLAVMRDSLPQVKVPALLIHSRNDRYVVEGSMDKIYEQLGSTDKQKLWVEGGGHVITEEPTRTAVFQAAGDFIERVSHT